MKTVSLFVLIILILSGCKKPKLEEIENRTFKMGFSSWSFGPTSEDREENYDFIFENGDIYSEQIDDRIPWNAWINGTDLPSEFVEDIDYRVSKINPEKQLLLSISPLNTDRSEFIDDRDGSGTPSYTAMNDAIIEDALVNHISYLVNRFNPDYLVVSMESNELYFKSNTKWNNYRSLMKNVRTRLGNLFPAVQISESVVLHNWYEPEIEDETSYLTEMKAFVNEMDFAAISFYPFFKAMNKSAQFQKAFDFLHQEVTIPIAFVETTHLANDLDVPAYEISISSDEKEQDDYLKTLLSNADKQNYLFIIWWSYRDYDKLWETFPEEVKDIGKLWRDTGLEDESGNKRPAHETWQRIYVK